jgi:putative flippase GtrA
MIAWASRLLNEVPLRKIIAFLLVGGTAAVTYSSVCTLLVHWFPAYKFLISVGVHACIIPIAFMGQRNLTFQSSGRIAREFPQYAMLQMASIIASASLLVWFVSTNPLYNFILFLMIAGCAATISFVTCNFVIFRRTPPEKASDL